VPLPAEVDRLTDAFLGHADALVPDLVTDLHLHGSLCWGEFFDDSDIDFVGVLDGTPTHEQLEGLAQAHAKLRDQFSSRRFEGFHCRRSDLEAPPAALGGCPGAPCRGVRPPRSARRQPRDVARACGASSGRPRHAPVDPHRPRRAARVHPGRPGVLLAHHPRPDRHGDGRAGTPGRRRPRLDGRLGDPGCRPAPPPAGAARADVQERSRSLHPRPARLPVAPTGRRGARDPGASRHLVGLRRLRAAGPGPARLPGVDRRGRPTRHDPGHATQSRRLSIRRWTRDWSCPRTLESSATRFFHAR